MKIGFSIKDNYDIDDLVCIMRLLRGDNGCDWDREQDHHSIRNNFIEETYEVIEAIDTDDAVLLREELGDVLLQVVFHSQMEDEKGAFSFDDVCDGLCKKLIYRHPHVFGDLKVSGSGQILENWDRLKQQEKHQTTVASTLASVSRSLPALMRSYKIQKRAAKSGFDYASVNEALVDLKSEIAELERALTEHSEEGVPEELGDILFSAVNVSRLLHLDPEEQLYRSADKFIKRFTKAEALSLERGVDIKTCGPAEQDKLWKEAKK